MSSLKTLNKRKQALPEKDDTPMTGYICYRCGKVYAQQRGNFPVSHGHMFRGYGYLPWCNTCIDQLWEYYVNLFGDKVKALRRLCMIFDLYFNEKTLNIVVKTSGQRPWIRAYIAKVNTYNNIDRTFDDTLRDEEDEAKRKREQEIEDEVKAAEAGKAETEAKAAEDEAPEEEVSEELVRFWGAGHDPATYRDLEIRMADWRTKYPDDYVFDGAEMALLKQVCNLEVSIARDMSAGKPIEKSVNALNTVLGSLNIKPVQKKEELGDDILNMPLGVGIQKWEETLPLPKMPEELIDQNDIIRNIHTWFYGHTCKMVGVKN